MTKCSNSSVATATIGGRTYAVVSEHRCVTCNSPFRLEIERQAIAGRTWKKIVESLPDDAGLTARNLADHWSNGHVPIMEPTVEEIRARDSERRGEELRPAVDHLVEHFEFARALLFRVRNRVAAGELDPDIRDGLAAARFLAQFEPTTQTPESDIVDGFIEYMDTAGEVMNAEQFEVFCRRLSNNPTLERLAAAWDARHVSR